MKQVFALNQKSGTIGVLVLLISFNLTGQVEADEPTAEDGDSQSSLTNINMFTEQWSFAATGGVDVSSFNGELGRKGTKDSPDFNALKLYTNLGFFVLDGLYLGGMGRYQSFSNENENAQRTTPNLVSRSEGWSYSFAFEPRYYIQVGKSPLFFSFGAALGTIESSEEHLDGQGVTNDKYKMEGSTLGGSLGLSVAIGEKYGGLLDLRLFMESRELDVKRKYKYKIEKDTIDGTAFFVGISLGGFAQPFIAP